MTVLHVLDHSLPVLSGYSTRSRGIVTFQRELGWRPVVVTSARHPAGPAEETIEGIRHFRTAVPAGGVRRGYAGEIPLMVRLGRRVAEVARREGAQVLHAHSPVLNGLPALVAGRRLGLRVVYEVRAFWEDAAVDHGTTREGSLRYRATRALETVLLKRVDHVVTIAQAMRSEIIGRGVDAARVTLVPNGVDLDRFHPLPRDGALAGRLGVRGGPVLGFVGSFYRYEGLRFLVEALPELRERVPGLQVLLVGGGEDMAALQAMGRGLGDALVLPGQVPHGDVAAFYSLIDAFVCPRRRMRLTELVTPLKPLEAMAMGLPVLASDVGGLSELVQHERTGLLFEAESRPALVREGSRLAGDPGLRSALGAAARAHVAAERSWREIVKRYREVYEPALPASTERVGTCAS